MKQKCIIDTCMEFANYNYKTCFNPGYCYAHKTSDMTKIGEYCLDDFVEITWYGIEKFCDKLHIYKTTVHK